MKVARCALIVLVLCVVSSRRFVNGFIDPLTVGSVITMGLRLENEITSITSGSGNDVGQLRGQISQLSRKIDSFQENFLAGNIMGFINLPRQILTETLIADHSRDLNEQIEKISRKYDLMKEYVDPTSGYENVTINDFARDCISSVDGVAETIERLHNLIIPRKDGFDNRNLLELLADRSRDQTGTHCSDTESHQHLLYRLYNVITVAEIKGFALMQFSYTLRRLYGHGNFTSESRLSRNRYQIRLNKTLDAFRSEMSTASPDVWRCDPPHPIGEDTYTEMVRFIHPYVAAEEELDPYGGCWNTCGYYKNTKEYLYTGSDYRIPTHGRQRRCSGKLRNCAKHDSKMSLCLASNATRGGPRYEYIQLDDGRVYGKKDGHCDESRNLEVERTHIYHTFPYDCEKCLCYCEESGEMTDALFDIREVVADVRSNKIVTGIRIVRDRTMIRLNIEQGELFGDGVIANTTGWMNSNPRESNLREGVDYARLSWDERHFALQDVTAEPGHCLTGVKLVKQFGILWLRIMTTPFDFTTGRLIDPLRTSRWRSNDASELTGVELKNPDRPTRSPLPSIPDFGKDQYVIFGPSDLSKDAGQSTVPFIDTQPILPNPRVVLTGAGIYYKGRVGYGGYIAPKVRTYNYAPYLRTDQSISDR